MIARGALVNILTVSLIAHTNIFEAAITSTLECSDIVFTIGKCITLVHS